ncbi:hypothetical protein [Caldicellulosiruptor naganoensis]|uniref:Lipoprotein n=1 Tax=Caldicellulosiruptor naganoensis TaxID=29324 RepID=A0ABY7BMM9_9FIRM|nr:hypothetical protein [Caldicellulosiruptor naganoensis]WAM32281.1 hypothetical protein OTJ99_000807 [Caldicellulosiruptor naganoensis]
MRIDIKIEKMLESKILSFIVIAILIMVLLASCKSGSTQGTLKIYPDYIAKGSVEIVSNKLVSKYYFSEQRVNGKVKAEFQKDERKIKITKEDGKIILEGRELKNIAEDIF